MSQENVEMARRLNALANAGEWEAVLDAFHAQVEWRDLAHAPDTPEIVRGLEAVRALRERWIEVFDEFGAEINEYIDAHPWVICDARWYGRGRGGEVTIDTRQADAYEFENGKVIRVVLAYPDVETALRAVGLQE
jgi:ketosteroid isomerase-like protein